MSSGSYIFSMMDNYIYLYHTNTLICIPTYPETIQDQIEVSFQSTTPLTRSAPIYSYDHSGPRSVNIQIKLHREMMTQLDIQKCHLNIKEGVNSLSDMNLDYVDTIIKEIQGAALPKYGAEDKMVDPPMVAVRFGTEFFCKGVINGPVGVTYSGPILETNKYAMIDISFNIYEVDPYDADSVMRFGSYRGDDISGQFLNLSLERNVYSTAGMGASKPSHVRA